MGEPDGSTAEFQKAAEAFGDASERVWEHQAEAYRRRARADVLDTNIREREREVAGSDAVQAAPAEGPHNAETRAARMAAMLSRDGVYTEWHAEVNQLRTVIAQNDWDLESARDQRSLAQRQMDFAIATAGGED